MTLLDIKEFSEKVKQTKESQLKALQLAKKQLIDEADTVPATEFDKLINPKLKSVITNYYQRKSIDDNVSDYHSIKLSKDDLFGLYYRYDDNDDALISEYLSARKVLVGDAHRSLAETIVVNRIRARLYRYLTESKQPWVISDFIENPDQMSIDDRQRNIQLCIEFSINDIINDL